MPHPGQPQGRRESCHAPPPAAAALAVNERGHETRHDPCPALQDAIANIEHLVHSKHRSNSVGVVCVLTGMAGGPHVCIYIYSRWAASKGADTFR